MNKELLRRCVQRAKMEIFDEIYHGRFKPEQIRSFTDLHDYVDANEFGGLTDDITFQDMDHKEFMAFAEAVQDRVNQWLVTGGHLDPLDL